MCNFLSVLTGFAKIRAKNNRKETQSSSRAGGVDRGTSTPQQAESTAEVLWFIYKLHLTPAALMNSSGESFLALSWKTQVWDRGPCNEFSNDICQE